MTIQGGQVSGLLTGMVMGVWSLLAGCGQNHHQISSQDQAVAPRYGMLFVDEIGRDEMRSGRLRFRGFNKEYLNAEVSLGIKLGWLGFGTSMNVNTGFLSSSTGGVFLTKTPLEPDSGIFLNDEADLDVRSGEEFTAECFYGTSFSLQYEGEAAISFAGSGVRGQGGFAKIMDMEATSEIVDVRLGDNLQKLEDRCQSLFESQYRAQLKRDLGRAIKSQLVIHKHFDQRIQALEKILGGQQERISFGNRVFNVASIGAETSGDGSIKTTGVLEAGQGWSKRNLEFEHIYSKKSDYQEGQGSRMQLVSSKLLPRSVDEDYSAALVAAGYIARNQVEYVQSVKEGRPFTIDSSLRAVLK